MMIMLRSTRLCVYNKVLVPFEASLFFCANENQFLFFFTCLYFRVSPSKRRFDFFFRSALFSLSSQTRREKRSFAFARARKDNTKENFNASHLATSHF